VVWLHRIDAMLSDATDHGGELPLRLGIAGLGLAGAFMVRAAAVHPRIVLCAGMDPLPDPRRAFADRFSATATVHADFESLCKDSSIEAIYIASPHRFHADQAVEAMRHGKHVLVEKPLALTAAECDAVVAAADRTGMQVVVGHTHAFDPNIRAMHRLLANGELGRLGMILLFNYNDFLLRPHRGDEFDREKGGGIAFNQITHQIEIVRLLGGRVKSVRANLGALDSARVAPGHCMAFLDLENGATASVTFSAYDFFDSDEFHDWIAEGGLKKSAHRHGETRRAFRARTSDRDAHRTLAFGGRVLPDQQPHLPHFGIIVVTCERGDMRLSPNGIVIHGLEGTREVAVPRGPGWQGQGDALDALWAAVREGRPSVHDARWGKATVEVVQAIVLSSAERREVILTQA
jgi:phthalate 4,5-cis-dihydrodiol dehydrogenase